MDHMLAEVAALLRTDEQSKVKQLSTQLSNRCQTTHDVQLYDALSICQPSYLPLITIYLFCTNRAGSWSAFELCRQFWKAWRYLPEEAKCGRASEAANTLVSTTLQLVNTSYGSVLDLLHQDSPKPALICPEHTHTISHASLGRLISSFALPTGVAGKASKPVVAISLPNGSLLATVLLATATYFTAAPMQHGNGVGPEQFKRDVLQSGSNFVLASAADVDRLRLRDAWLRDAHIQVLLVEMSKIITFQDVNGSYLETSAWPRPRPNQTGDIAVLLFTSGTSGSKKLVPLHLETLVTGVAMVQSSWRLDESSRCLNQMPLNHVGGIVRNLFAPIMSGGSVICCSGFDAHAFWDAVDDYAPTWYYASPTMHQCILEAAADRRESVARSQISLVCNAAGGLLPSLAIQLRDTFSRSGHQCTVLPSYGMTECMPISTPPLDYKLERTGTSGVSVGPEITVLDSNDKQLSYGTVGRIAVRGAPVFAGYLKDGQLDKSCFTNDGWFDTGDMGYLDSHDYLYITGRSKEVINRGGELISPFEVEDAVLAAAKDPASPIFGRVSKALAFSMPHDVLQEVVGLVIVTPAASRRPCLETIRQATKDSLASVKVPTVLVFMTDNLPLNNNKVLRIRLAERLDITSISDSTPQSERYYEAVCPAVNTPLTTGIQSRVLVTSTAQLEAACTRLLPPTLDFHVQSDSIVHPTLLIAPKHEEAASTLSLDSLKAQLFGSLDSYHVPSQIRNLPKPFPRTSDGRIDEKQLNEKVSAPSAWQGISQAETKIIIAFSDILGVPAHTLHKQSNFFDLGGDSMKAGRLLSALRKSFATRITIDTLFSNSTVGALTAILETSAPPTSTAAAAAANIGRGLAKSLPGCTQTYSSTRPLLLALQLVPICVVAPLRRALTWTFFIYSLTYSQELSTQASIPGRFLNLVISLFLGKFLTAIIFPLIAIMLKWMIIGRYEEGLYPMWGAYHTRWWLVQKILSVGGMGVYRRFNATRLLYYRCLGAHIGRNVIIHENAKLGEYDLVSIGDNVVLDACKVRPFAAERNTSMYLGRIRIGIGASVGTASLVAAGTIVPAAACVGANSSSWELSDADEANRDLSQSQVPKPTWVLEWFVGLPIVLFASFIGGVPWMGGLMPLVISEPIPSESDQLRETLIWFSTPQRIVFHYVALALNVTLGPVFFFGVVLAIKHMLDRCCGGPLRAGPARNRSQLDMFRMHMMSSLMSTDAFSKLSGLFGTHYSATSVFARLLGAKVGQHVYWPGKGPNIDNFEMLEVGDSVVFGSRSHIITSDGLGTKEVKIGAGAMVADRVILRPGTVLGDSTVMGSGALSRREKSYPAGTTWVGSKNNDAICLSVLKSKETTPILQPHSQVTEYSQSDDDRSTNTSRASSIYDQKFINVEVTELDDLKDDSPPQISSPFGRAFYQGLAPYRVWSQFTIAMYSTCITIFTAVFWNIPSIGAIQIGAWIIKQPSYTHGFLRAQPARPLIIYACFTLLIAAIMFLSTLSALSTIIAAKWILIGRRRQGNYDWDKSSYCQRWQLLLKIESLRSKCYGAHGILGLLTGTHWIVLYFRALGADIGKDCALFASGTPSLYFTEPDLLTLGDRVSVDDASLVGHINTRGKFALNPLVVGKRSVLRSGSRLLSGARMEADSCLLEHTLVMAGDVVEAETAIQGWPGEEFKGNRMPTMRVAYHWEMA